MMGLGLIYRYPKGKQIEKQRIITRSLRLDSLLGSSHVDKKYCLEMTYRYGLNFWISLQPCLGNINANRSLIYCTVHRLTFSVVHDIRLDRSSRFEVFGTSLIMQQVCLNLNIST